MSSSPRDDKTLILMRHAKAEEGIGKPDHDRELAARAGATPRAAGRWLHEQGLVPDLVLCSRATRTRQTWDEAVTGEPDARSSSSAAASTSAAPSRARDGARRTRGARRTVLVVGHNPTMAELASMLSRRRRLARRRTRPSARASSRAALAVLSYTGEWADIDAGLVRADQRSTSAAGHRRVS